VASSCDSRRTVFRRIAHRAYTDWPVYDSTPLYNRTSLTGLESDVRVVSKFWFEHDAHTSVEQFVCFLPLAYFKFDSHDRYGRSTCYDMDTLFRVFVLKELHGWDHETALVEYLKSRQSSVGNWVWRPFLISQRCGAAGTTVSREVCARPSRKQLEQSSSKRRTRMLPFRANRNEASRLKETTQTNRIRITESSSTKPRRLPSTSVGSSSPRSRSIVETAVRYTRTPTG
jgi:hypothetical protein